MIKRERSQSNTNYSEQKIESLHCDITHWTKINPDI